MPNPGNVEMRQFIPTELAFTLFCEPDDLPIKGNALVSGDDEADRECEEKIQAQLDAGNRWAWCLITIRADWGGFSGFDNLGACSYVNAEGFCQPGDYYEDMVGNAIEDLLDKIRECGWQVNVSDAEYAAAKRHGFETMEIVNRDRFT